ncbi:hypothetical protein AMAG_19278 [Allomyces macrogynus ATCC 38327]|uniref:Uncharacterized protein n=1 Tax=Allomyces macrogynus (strain ATCC 38327) TaxID=578462 RepID=A0A0L0SQY7_ALLM3|nr:hypothetical protein AMAG_19278 [Allomyces macrogynus ATCC 38327]|eukprot:KNE64775.1 hypothetical protein AMAG_19278 [Allomyces macrogynus ATCC 38327]
MSNPFARKSSANLFATMSAGGGSDALARTSSFGVVMSSSCAPALASAGRTSATRKSTLSQMMGVWAMARKNGTGERAVVPAAGWERWMGLMWVRMCRSCRRTTRFDNGGLLAGLVLLNVA